MSTSDSVQTLIEAFERITAWMNAHGARLLAENLAPGASAEQLAAAELRFGFPLPAELRALWLLHDGQREEMNGFFEAFDLFSLERSFAERGNVLRALQSLGADAPDGAGSGLTYDELAFDRWIPFPGRDSDALAVNAVSGRVMKVKKDWPPCSSHSDSIVSWAAQYAARVVANDYRVEEGSATTTSRSVTAARNVSNKKKSSAQEPRNNTAAGSRLRSYWKKRLLPMVTARPNRCWSVRRVNRRLRFPRLSRCCFQDAVHPRSSRIR